VLDHAVREVAVPDLTAPDLALGTPEVFRARTVPELRQLKADPKATPTAAREFSRTERVFVRINTYGSPAPTVTARLLNRAGDAMADLPVTPASNGDQSARDVDLTLAALPPGEYLVELTASGSAAPVKQIVGFRVTG
jgi:hypothetical protein